jgi:copper chaperone CopZ
MHRIFAALTTALVLLVASDLQAAEPITITVEKMCCAGCAKRIAAQLYAVPGVAEIEADVEAKQFTIKSESKKHPSPRAMWEAIEKGKDTPIKIVCSKGTFTKRPKH